MEHYSSNYFIMFYENRVWGANSKFQFPFQKVICKATACDEIESHSFMINDSLYPTCASTVNGLNVYALRIF